MKTILTFAILALTLGHAIANYADSPNVTVDTRDLVIGDLVIEGSSSIAPFQNTQYTARLGGVDVSSQCTWPVPKSSGTYAGWWAYPSISATGLLNPHSAQPGDVIEITARYAEPGGDTRQAFKSVTVGDDGGLYFGINQDIDYLGTAGSQFDWQLTASISGQAANQSGITFTWYLDGVLKATGTAKTYVYQKRGLPTVSVLRVTASDGQGHTAEQTETLDFRALAPGEPGQRYDVWRKSGVSFTNKLGNPVTPDPAKKDNGVIVLTHGLWSSPYDDWIEDLAAEIENKLSGPGQPNIVIFGWKEDASPGKLYGTEPERLATVASSLGISASALRAVFADTTPLTNFLFDGLMIRETAKNQGRSSLAEWFRKEALLGNISKTAPIHLIGHSAGGFVMGECYKELDENNDGFNIQRVTMLDTPFAEKRHVDAGNPAVVERYVSSLLGRLCPQIDPLSYSAWSGLQISEKANSSWYHRLDVGSWFDTWSPLRALESHGYSHEWYDGTVPSYSEQEGFQLSPFITGGTMSLAALLDQQNTTAMDEVPSVQNMPLPPVGISGFTTFGTVTGTGAPYVLTENGNAGIVKNMTLPADAAGLSFNYQFTSPGDGDFIAVFFGDSPPLFIASPTESNTAGVAVAEVSLEAYAGLSGDLVIKLVAQESANAVVTVDTIQMTRDDDIDGDGLLAAAEVAAGTDPRLADSDGDGIDDPTELNTTLTNPALADSDGDGSNDGSEMEAGTNPLDGSSRFAVKSSVKAAADFTISWSSVAGRKYRIIRSTEPSFQSYDVVGASIPAAPPEQSYTDTGGATGSRMFYRVELEP